MALTEALPTRDASSPGATLAAPSRLAKPLALTAKIMDTLKLMPKNWRIYSTELQYSCDNKRKVER